MENNKSAFYIIKEHLKSNVDIFNKIVVIKDNLKFNKNKLLSNLKDINKNLMIKKDRKTVYINNNNENSELKPKYTNDDFMSYNIFFPKINLLNHNLINYYNISNNSNKKSNNDENNAIKQDDIHIPNDSLEFDYNEYYNKLNNKKILNSRSSKQINNIVNNINKNKESKKSLKLKKILSSSFNDNKIFNKNYIEEIKIENYLYKFVPNLNIESKNSILFFMDIIKCNLINNFVDIENNKKFNFDIQKDYNRNYLDLSNINIKFILNDIKPKLETLPTYYLDNIEIKKFFTDFYQEYNYIDIQLNDNLNFSINENKNFKNMYYWKKAIDQSAIQTNAIKEKEVSKLFSHYINLINCNSINKITDTEDISANNLFYTAKEDDFEEENKSKEDNKDNAEYNCTNINSTLNTKIKKNNDFTHSNNITNNDNYYNNYNKDLNKYNNKIISLNYHINISKRSNTKFVNNYKIDDNLNSQIQAIINGNTPTYKPSDINFGIGFSGLVEKKIKKSNDYHLRAITIKGPTFSWFRYKNSIALNQKKGEFDLRLCKIEDINNIFIDENVENYKSYKENSYENNIDKKNNVHSFKVSFNNLLKTKQFEKTLFLRCIKYKYLNNKSFKQIILQVINFYNNVKILLRLSLDFNKLKFLSVLYLDNFYSYNNETNKLVIESLSLHCNLKFLTLKGVDKNCLYNLFKNLNSNETIIKLELISLEAVVNTSIGSIIELDVNNIHFKNYFTNNKNSDNIKEIYFINFKLNESNAELLFSFLFTKYMFLVENIKQINENIKDSIIKLANNKKSTNYDDNIKILFPYRCIGIKKTVNNVNGLECIIPLNKLYNFLMDIIRYYSISSSDDYHNFKSCLELLDLEGCSIKEPSYINKIIFEFGLIKELNISECKVIDSKDYTKSYSLSPNNNVVTNSYLKREYNDILEYLINHSCVLKTENLKNCADKKVYFSALCSLYIKNTPITQDSLENLISLFNVLPNLKEIYITQMHNYLDSIKEVNLTRYIKKFDDNYCDNILEIEFY